MKKHLLIAGIAIVLIATAQKAEAVNWTTETVDSYGSVGKHTSLALDKDGWPHISYYDDSNNDLKYAYKDGSGWHRTTVDATLYYYNAWTSIALDSLGYPHISYHDDGNDDLKYAYKDNSGWHIETVDSYGSVGSGSEIALDSDGYPHIAYYGDYDGHRRLKYAFKDFSGWHTYTRVWDITSQNWTGTPFSIALDLYDFPHISYFDDNNLKYIYKMGTSWTFETIETGYGEGSGTSIALDQSGYPHIAYNRESGEDLKYAYKDETGWHLYTVDSDGYVGDCPSIALDYQDYPHISHGDYTHHDLKYAYKDGTGWHNQTVQSYNNVGYWSSIAINYSGEPHISYYDDTNDDLRFARPQTYGPQPFTLISPTNGSWTNTEPTFMWEACGYQGDSLSRYELWVDGAWNRNVSKTRTFSEPASPLSSSWRTWNVKAVKLDGNSIWSNETWSVRIDATHPIIFNINSPDDNTWTSDRTPTLTWEASADAESGLKEYRLYIDGSLARVGIHPDSTSTTTLWNLSSGDHTWYIVAVDNAGNSTQSNQIWTVKIDYTGPNYFSLYSPDNYSYTSIDTPTFIWESTTDLGIGLSHYQLWMRDYPGSYYYYMVQDSIIATTYTLLFSENDTISQVLSHGRWYWKIRALDALGNYRETYTRTLNVDLEPPLEFSLSSPADSSIATLPTPIFHWNSTSDNDASLSHYQLWIDSTLNVDNLTVTSSAPSIPLAEGYHSWFVKAIDNVGNIRNSNETWTVILEWNPPTAFDLASPAHGDTVFLSSPVLSWHPSSDAGSGIQKYQLWINNNLNFDNIPPTDTSATPANPLENGQYNWFVKSVDFAGNITSSISIWTFVVNVDYIPPISQIIYPADGDTIDVISVVIQGTSTDGTGIGVDSVFVSTNDGQTWHLVQKVNENYDNWTYLWENLNYGDYIIRSRAKDFGGNLEFPGDSIRVYVKNSLPYIVNPLPDLSLIEDGPDTFLLSLDSVFSDLNVGDTLLYTYGVIPSDAGINITINESTHIPTINLEENWNGNAQVIFSAMDNQSDVVHDTIAVNVLSLNDPPEITTTELPDAIEDQEYSFEIEASDVDLIYGDNLTYSLSVYPEGMTLNDTSGKISWFPDNDDVGDTTVTVVVTDDSSATDTQTFSLHVNNTNDAPVIVTTLIDDAVEDQEYIFIIEATDPDIPYGDHLTYSITVCPEGITINSTTGVISWLPDNNDVGDTILTVLVTDDSSATNEKSFTLTIINSNDAPSVAYLIPDQYTYEDTLFNFTFGDSVFKDVDIGDSLRYSATLSDGSVLPAWLSFEATLPRTFSGTPTNDDIGNISIKVTATDDSSAIVSTEFNLDVINTNDAPVLYPISDKEMLEDTTLTVTVTATDDDDMDQIELSVESDTSAVEAYFKDKGTELTRELILIPENNWNGVATITITVIDNASKSSDTTSFMLTVLPLNDPPEITTTELPDAIEDQEYSFGIEASDVDHIYGDHFTYSLMVYPEGMTINDTSGKISWLPDNDDVGDTTVTVVVADDSSATDMKTYTLTVINVNDPPILAAISDTSFDEDSQLIIALSYFYTYVDDPDNADSTLTFAFSSTDYINVNASEDSLILYAQTDWNGADTLQIIVSDVSLSDTTSWRIIVNPVNDAPVITSVDSVSVTEDIYFKYLATASDTEDSSITFSYEDLSCWLSSDADSVYGVPTEGMEDTSFVVIASDGELNDTLTVILTVIAVNDPPTISMIPDTSFNEDKQLKFAISYFYDFVYDPDNADSSLVWSFSDTDYVYVTMDKDSVTLSSQIDWFGKDTLSAKVSDGEFFDEASFVITVHPVNDPPYFTELMPDSILFDSNVHDTLLLAELVSDVDNPDSTLNWSYIRSSFVLCHINDTLNRAIFWVEENMSGQDTVVLSVSDGEFTVYDSLIVIVNPVTGIEYLMSQIPREYSLKQNYPNPFNPTTTIIYGLPKHSHVDIRIYDLLGREVTTLVNDNQEAKHYKVIWDAKDRSGNTVPSGMYLYRIVAKSGNKTFVKTKKLLLMR
ncbi:MAG: tandem-95 repeat protein [Candidatus Marinimicrobia bacterium]|nr:tandem-95 repeat protein [Candidatus Neomarinimicrobiota bacterium]